MKIAFAYWDKRIAPVFDTALHVRIVDVVSGRIVREADETLPEDPILHKTLRLVQLGIDTLVCGAISRSLLGTVSAYGIQVVSFVAGELDEVIQAWLMGNPPLGVFAMPGCRGRGRRRFRGMHNKGRLTDTLRKRGSNMEAKESARQPGRGRKGGGMGVVSAAVAAVGCCVCSRCGHTEEHKHGQPCSKRDCPKCGFAMSRL